MQTRPAATRTVREQTMLTPEERSDLAAAAEAVGQTRSEFTRQAIRTAIQHLKDHTR